MKNDQAHDYLRSLDYIKDDQLLLTEDLQDALRMLASGKGDAALMPKLVGLIFIKKLNLRNLALAPLVVEEYKRPFSVAVSEGNQELLERINQGLSILKETGQQKEIFEKWFGIFKSPEISFTDVLKVLFWFFLALVLIGAVLSFWFAALKRQVSIRTKDLKEEIEERKGVEEALRESELSYRTLAENLPGLVYRVLIREKGRTQFFNDMLQTMTGYRTGELKKGEICSIEPLILPENLGGVAISVEEAIKKKTPFEVEYRILHKDGNIRYFSERGRPVFGEDGNPLFIDGSIFEITERKQAEEALREGEAKYKSLTNNLNVGVFRNSVGSKGKFIEGNPAIVKMFGYDSKEEFLKIGVSNLYINSHERKEFSSKIEKAGSVKNEVLELQKKDGTVLIGSVSAVAVKNKNDGIKYFDGIIEDITEQKRAEEEKKKLESQFIHAQRMESIGTLAGGIAHDFNNLLMAIQGRASTMLTNKDVSSPDFEHLRGIEDYVESAADLTKQLLGFAMGGKYEVKPTDLNALIDKQNRMFGRTKKEIIIKSKYQENIWPVEIDRGQIDQVLLNLYVNAWQAMPGGGELFLETENVTLDEDDVKPFATEPGRYVKISVSDTGVGMDKATLERIFGILHLSQKVVYTFVISRFRREIGNWKLEIRKKHINSGVLSNF